MPSNLLCIYHQSCLGGFVAAWVARQTLGSATEYIPAKYQTPPPDVDGKNVLIVDFSYPRSVMLGMAARAESIVVLDHHKTAQTELVDLPGNVECIFDMERSGAVLAWQYFHPRHPAPQWLRHVEDRDLWCFALEHTHEVCAALSSYPFDFAVWDLLPLEQPNIDWLIADGVALLRERKKIIAQILAQSRRTIKIMGVHVPVVNIAPNLASDVLHELAQGQPFAVGYHDTAAGREFSLRSSPDGFDVGAIAQHFGGGGHRHAAGFRQSLAPIALNLD